MGSKFAAYIDSLTATDSRMLLLEVVVLGICSVTLVALWSRRRPH